MSAPIKGPGTAAQPLPTTQRSDIAQNDAKHGKKEGGLGTGGSDLGSMGQQGRKGQQPPTPQTTAAFAAQLEAAQIAQTSHAGPGLSLPRSGAVQMAGDADEAGLLEEMSLLAQQGPGLVQTQTTAQTAPPPAQVRGDLPEIVRAVTERVQSTEAMRAGLAGGSTPFELVLPPSMQSIGLGAASLVFAGQNLSVVFRVAQASDPAVIAGVMQELAARLAQQFPKMAIRVLQDDELSEAKGRDDSSFNPLTQAVGRRT